ncbi:MBL fold metallo-hydrolase [Paenibacillus yanchengensis]|uniref:MBL fold metallo-hydrolase n=1 Tax=Paenibacillus yanchengensis TaxID=2035833 RepID=A0ABW4YLF4_9BACL
MLNRLLQVKIPLPYSLKYTNSYWVKGQNGWTIIDPGLRTNEAIIVYEQTLAEQQITWSDITQIIVTHQHPDHYGMAGYVQQHSAAPVYMSKRSHAYTQRLWGDHIGGGSEFNEALGELFRQHGMPESLIEAIAYHLLDFKEKVLPHPKVTYISAGENIVIGDRSFLLLEANGHAAGQLCMYNEGEKIMFCGDQVLNRITPNISIVPGETDNPLASFLNSLDELKQYDVRLAYPGHREVITNFRERIEQLEAHHQRRLLQLKEMLDDNSYTAFACCELFFGTHLRTNPHNLRFAMAETIAHLAYLHAQGEIEQQETAEVLIYRVITK